MEQNLNSHVDKVLHSVGDLIHYFGESAKDGSIPTHLTLEDAIKLVAIGSFLRAYARGARGQEAYSYLTKDSMVNFEQYSVSQIIDFAGQVMYNKVSFEEGMRKILRK